MTPAALAALHARSIRKPRPWTETEFASLLASPHVFLIGGATAFALGRTAADEAELLTLVTAPEYRRQGLARRCLAAFEAEAAQRGATVSLLEVAADNHAACDLYASAGYNEAGRRRGYYDSSTDALILRKKIASS